MSTWLAIPSKRPPEEAEKVLKLWRERGYKLAVYRDHTDPELADLDMQIVGCTPYPGYAMAVNSLCQHIMLEDPQAEWICTGGDDVEPDANHSAEEIAQECSHNFSSNDGLGTMWKAGTFGVMQPTGDPWSDTQGRIIERIAGSPWMGREFCRRMNGGQGPLWPEYTHCFEDEELQCVAQKLGVFWQRPDLVHKHNNWARTPNAKPPAFLAEANSPQHWAKYKALFERRKAGGFPGSNPID